MHLQPYEPSVEIRLTQPLQFLRGQACPAVVASQDASDRSGWHPRPHDRDGRS